MVLIPVVPPDSKCRQMRRSLYQLQFKCLRCSRNAAVHLEGPQHVSVPQRNVGGPIEMKSKLQSSLSDSLEITLCVIRQQHDRYYVSYLKIDGCAQVIENLNKRGAHRDHIQNVFFSQQIRTLPAGAIPLRPRSSADPFASASVFSHSSLLLILPP